MFENSFKKKENGFVEEKLIKNTSNFSNGQNNEKYFGEVFRFETVYYLQRECDRRKTKLAKKIEYHSLEKLAQREETDSEILDDRNTMATLYLRDCKQSKITNNETSTCVFDRWIQKLPIARVT